MAEAHQLAAGMIASGLHIVGTGTALETPMYVDVEWRPSGEPPPREPRLNKRQERVVLWLIAVNVLLLPIAPIGGATIIHAVFAMLKHG